MNATISIVGRPNVGKSSLFNVLLGYRRSIVSEISGTTLDRISERIKWDNHEEILLVDTQGALQEADEAGLRFSIDKAEAVLFVVDAKSGITPFDRWIATVLHQSKKQVLLIVNKDDNKDSSMESDFAELDFPTISVSAAHKYNLEAIRDWCRSFEGRSEEASDGKEGAETDVKSSLITVALMGRPNTGKSTLMNSLCHENISRVSPTALTTRDPVSFEIQTQTGTIRLLDTAGMRRPRSKKEDIEVFSIHASTRSMRQADVVMLLIASHEAITDQDMRLLNLLVRENKPTVLLLNFWDKLDTHQRKHFVEDSEFSGYLKHFEVIPISGKTGFNTDKCLKTALRLARTAKKRVQTSKLNKIVERIIEKNPPPTSGKQNFNILYASQVGVEPPTFVFFMNRKGALPMSYQKYLENSLRKSLRFKGQAIRLFFRGGEERVIS